MSAKLTRSFRAVLAGYVLFATAAHAAVIVPPPGLIDGTASAAVMQVNPSGIGHVNIVPYYTVQGGYDTYLNLTNTDTRNGKAVKVRFRGAGNGDTVMDFTVLLSPGDMWSAAVTKDAATGLPRLVHSDKSCTLPANVQALFNTARLIPSPANQFTLAQQAGEGYVEIVAMADIPPETSPTAPPLFTAIRQVNGSPPCTISALNPLAADSTSYADARSKGLDAPTTGLMTRWTLINVPRASAYTGTATAVEARVTTGGQAGYGNVVLSPQTSQAVSDLYQVRAGTTDPLLRGGVADNTGNTGQSLDGVAVAVPAVASDFPDLSTPYLPSLPVPATSFGTAAKLQIHALSKALAVSSFANEYVLDPAIAARTEWVVSMPTRRYNVAKHYPALGTQPVFTNWMTNDLGAVLSLGTANYFTPANNWAPTPDLLCTLDIALESSDLAGTGRRTGAVFASREAKLDSRWVSPFNPGHQPFSICIHAGTLNFRQLSGSGESTVFGSSWNWWGAFYFDGTTSGWARLSTPGVGGIGLPIIGFAAMELFNTAATPGIAGTYSQTFSHSMTLVP